MSVRWRIGALLGLSVLLGTVACSEADEGTGIVKPRASASPSAAGQGGLKGGITGPDPSTPVVQYVRLDHSTLSLNVPAAPGLVPAGIPSTASLNPRAILADGSADPSGVDWQIQDATRLSVDDSGVVSVKAAALAGVTAVTAVSRRQPALKAQLAVTITRDGMIEVTGLTPGGSGYVRATVTQNGYNVATEALGELARLRLPSGQAYEMQLQRVAGAETSVVAAFPSLLVQPNAVTIATASP